jgi:hypothetical protein
MTQLPPERRAALERPYAAYKFPKYSKDEQVEKLFEKVKIEIDTKRAQLYKCCLRRTY